MKKEKLRKIEGEWVMRDHYRWFINAAEGIIWFYRSDVKEIKLVPPYQICEVGRYDWPIHQTVEMFVDQKATEHPQNVTY